MADLPDGFDLDALLAPIPGDSPAGVDIRENRGAGAPYDAIKDARSEAVSAEKRLDQRDPDAPPDPAPLWRTVRDVAMKVLRETSKDMEVAVYLTEALVRMNGLLGLAAGARTLAGLAEKYWDTVYPLPDPEYGLEDRIRPVTALNGADGNGSLMQPLYKTVLFDGPTGDPVAFYQYRGSEQTTTLAKPQLEAALKRGEIPFADMEKMARQQPRRFATVRSDARAALKAWEAMASVMDEKARDEGPSTTHVRDLLHALERVANRYAPEEAKIEEAADDGSLDESQQEDAGMETAETVHAVRVAGGPIRDRESALKQLEDLSAWFRRTEPHSPLAYTLEEAVRRGRLTWPELLDELVSDKKVHDDLLIKLGIRPAALAAPAPAPAAPAAPAKT